MGRQAQKAKCMLDGSDICFSGLEDQIRPSPVKNLKGRRRAIVQGAAAQLVHDPAENRIDYKKSCPLGFAGSSKLDVLFLRAIARGTGDYIVRYCYDQQCAR